MFIVFDQDGKAIVVTPDRALADEVAASTKGCKVMKALHAQTPADIACRDVYRVVVDEHGRTVNRCSEWLRPWEIQLGGRTIARGRGWTFQGSALTGFDEAERLAQRELEASKKPR